MQGADLSRRIVVALAVVAVVAGCATPEEAGPTDLQQDGDRDGVPDGNSPVPGANETTAPTPSPYPGNGTATNASS